MLLTVPGMIVSNKKTDCRSTSHIPIIADKTQLSLQPMKSFYLTQALTKKNPSKCKGMINSIKMTKLISGW